MTKRPEGSKRYIPVFEGLLDPKHIDKMGTAVFLFMELLRRSKGKPTVEVTYRDLHEILGKKKKPKNPKNPYRTLEDWLKKLKAGDYISVEGKNPMIVTIKNYRTIKYGKIQPVPDVETKGDIPRESVEPTPQETVEQENPIPRKSVETTQKSVEPDAATHLKTEISKPPFKYKKNTQQNQCDLNKSKGTKTHAGKNKKPTNPGVKILINHWHDEMVRIHKIRPTISKATGPIFKRELEENGRSLDELKTAITDFLSLREPKLIDEGFPVPYFANRLTGLLLKQKKQREPELVY